MNSIAIILCAGKQSRFKSDLPKALSKYKNTTLLQYNLNILNKCVDYIYIITSFDNQYYFNTYQTSNTRVIPIHSGLGSGDATYKALNEINKDIKEDSKVLLMWGDSIQNENIINQTLNNISTEFLTLPVYQDTKPYVEFKINEYNIVTNILFTKNGDITNDTGLHDYCLFGFTKTNCYNKLQQYIDKYFNQINYNTINKEFEFLNIMTEFKNSTKTFEIFNVSNNSFNTIEESKQILN